MAALGISDAVPPPGFLAAGGDVLGAAGIGAAGIGAGGPFLSVGGGAAGALDGGLGCALSLRRACKCAGRRSGC